MAVNGIFLSYASQDAAAARRIGDALRAGGLEVWFDQSELRGGDVWDETIRRQIAECALFVPVVSHATAARLEGYFRLEWALADQRTQRMARNKPFIVPVCIDNTRETSADVPESFVRVQWSRLDPQADLQPFVSRIRALIDAAAPAATPAAAAPVEAVATARLPRTALRRRFLTAAVIIALVASAVGLALWPRPPAAPAPNPPAAGPVAPDRTPERSIAVLPFIDLSEKHDQEYFSDGLSEELLDMLAQLPDLRVAARTSAFYFKGRAADIAEIGQKLHVAHVLEGSVRKAGSKVRVTAQLIRADSGYHVWSQTYDRDIHDIFKVQDEISGAVVAALKVQLLDARLLRNRHETGNTEAYAQYLIGKELRLQDRAAEVAQAVAAFRRATTLDPGYAAAFSALSEAEWRLADEHSNDPADYAQAAADAEHAITLAPDAPEGYWARGNLRLTYYYDWRGAGTDLEQAHRLDPAFAPANADRAELAATLGRPLEALDTLREVVSQDPLSGLAWRRLSDLLIDERRFDEARQAIAHIKAINDGAKSRIFLGDIDLLESRPADALQKYSDSAADNFWQQLGLSMALHSLGREAESTRQLDRVIHAAGDALSYQFAEAYAWRGDPDAAFRWLNRALVIHDGGLIYLKHDVFMEPLRSDARYAALLKTLNLPP